MTTGEISFAGKRMRTAATAERGVVSADTVLVFEQRGNVVSAHYQGGTIIDGYLIGHLDGVALHFQYIQAGADGRLDAGVSDGEVERLPDGRLRLLEHFRWSTRSGAGTNAFEEIAD